MKLVLDYFLYKKIIKKLHAALFADDNILFLDECSGKITFTTDSMSILCVNLNNIKLDGANVSEDDLKTIISEVWFGTITLNNARHLKNN